MNNGIGDDCCEVDKPFTKIQGPGDCVSGATMEVFPEGFSPQLTISIDDFQYVSDNNWKIQAYVVQYKIENGRYVFDYENQQPVMFNSNSYWSECGKFKRGKWNNVIGFNGTFFQVITDD